MNTNTHGMETLQLPCLEPAAQKTLLNTLRLLLASVPTLSLLLLVRQQAEASAEDGWVEMEAVATLLRSCLRRTDVVMSGGAASCAAVLLGAEGEGSLLVVQRLLHVFTAGPRPIPSLELGIALAPEEAREGEALLSLALRRRLALRSLAEMPSQRDAALAQSAALAALRRAFALEQADHPQAATRRRTMPGPVVSLGADSPARPDVATAQARARELGVPYLSPPRRIPSSLRNLLPPEIMRQFRCLPVGRERNALTVALADPTDTGVLLHLAQLTGMTIFPVMTDPEALEYLARSPRLRRSVQADSSAVIAPY